MTAPHDRRHYSYSAYADPKMARTFDDRRFGGPIGELVAGTQAHVLANFIGRINERSILDVGTGTGILAICASKLGFRDVVGVDIDPLAVDAAPGNVRLNHLSNVLIREGGITAADGAFDFIAANLLSEIILSIVPDIAARLKDTGIALLSGIMVGQEGPIITSMEQVGLKCVDKVMADIWISLVFKKQLA